MQSALSTSDVPSSIVPISIERLVDVVSVTTVKIVASKSLGPFNYKIPTGQYSIEEDMRLATLEQVQELLASGNMQDSISVQEVEQ